MLFRREKLLVITYAQSYESFIIWCVHVYIVFFLCSNSIINQSYHTIQNLTKMITYLIFWIRICQKFLEFFSLTELSSEFSFLSIFFFCSDFWLFIESFMNNFLFFQFYLFSDSIFSSIQYLINWYQLMQCSYYIKSSSFMTLLVINKLQTYRISL